MAAHAPRDRREQLRWLLGLSLAALVAVALRLPTLEIGRLSDDYVHHAMIAGLYPGDGHAPFDLYAFVRETDDLAAHVDAGTVPWYAEPEFHGSVMRPLASLLLWLDHTLAPGRVRLWHLHSLAWLGLTIVSFGLCARALLPRWPAALAVALLVCEAAFVAPVSWLANRCVLICATFGFAAIFVHLERRRPGPATPAWLPRAGPGLELALLALSLAGGEYGLGAVVYLGAWELFAGPSPAAPWTDRALDRGRALLPAALAACGFLAAHALLGYGSFAGGLYTDPLHDPRGWLAALGHRLPSLIAAAAWGIPADTEMVFQHSAVTWWLERWPAADVEQATAAHTRLGLAATAVFGLGLGLARFGLEPDERRTLRALLIGALIGLLLVTVAPPHARLLVFTQLGACVVIATLSSACVRLLTGRAPISAGRPRLARALGAGSALVFAPLLVLATFVEVYWGQVYTDHLRRLDLTNERAFTRGDLLDQELAGRDVILVVGPSQTIGMFGAFVLATLDQPVPASWRSLALYTEHATFVTRPRADTLELAAIQGAWLQTSSELFVRRRDQPLAAGAVLRYPGMTVEVLADDGGCPTRVRFRFPHDLDDPRYLFVISTERGLMRWAVPPVGGRAVVPRPRLPFPPPS